jgi:putative transposase
MVLDGVFTRDQQGRPLFHPVPAPTREELNEIVRRVRRRAVAWFARKGRLPSSSLETPAQTSLDACAAIAMQRGAVRALRDDAGAEQASLPGVDPPQVDANAVEHDGFNLHASIAVAGDDDLGRERLMRYAARPALALDRLRRLPGGRIVYRIKKLRDGHAKHRVTEPRIPENARRGSAKSSKENDFPVECSRTALVTSGRARDALLGPSDAVPDPRVPKITGAVYAAEQDDRYRSAWPRTPSSEERVPRRFAASSRRRPRPTCRTRPNPRSPRTGRPFHSTSRRSQKCKATAPGRSGASIAFRPTSRCLDVRPCRIDTRPGRTACAARRELGKRSGNECPARMRSMPARRIVRASRLGDVSRFPAPVTRSGHDSPERMNDRWRDTSDSARGTTTTIRAGDDSPQRMKSIGRAKIDCTRVAINLCTARESFKHTGDDSPERITRVARARACAQNGAIGLCHDAKRVMRSGDDSPARMTTPCRSLVASSRCQGWLSVFQQRMKFPSHLAVRVRSLRGGAVAPTCAISGTSLSKATDLGLHLAPHAAVVAKPRFEYDDRYTVPDAMDVQRSSPTRTFPSVIARYAAAAPGSTRIAAARWGTFANISGSEPRAVSSRPLTDCVESLLDRTPWSAPPAHELGRLVSRAIAAGYRLAPWGPSRHPHAGSNPSLHFGTGLSWFRRRSTLRPRDGRRALRLAGLAIAQADRRGCPRRGPPRHKARGTEPE